MNKIKIGTRGSKLALWQAYHVQDLLKAAELESEIVLIDTKGDQRLDVAIAKIGSKGVFTAELEEQLQDGRIDIAVHSAKDMQSLLPEGFEIIAYTKREKPHDVLLSRQKKLRLGDASREILLGTSSTRRVAILRHFYPHIRTVEVRGNLQTRIRKMEEGLCDGLLLAYAGVHRMGYDAQIVEHLSLEEFIPAVGQGSVAIESSMQLDSQVKMKIRVACDDPATSPQLRAERAFLRVLEGGCSIPAFALATAPSESLMLKGGIISLDGTTRICNSVTGNAARPEELGELLAKNVLEAGGNTILQEIKAKKL